MSALFSGFAGLGLSISTGDKAPKNKVTDKVENAEVLATQVKQPNAPEDVRSGKVGPLRQ
ncbi:MAG TPA: hypothetical protein VIM11_02500 [Tepidisphaeraceae bacterium]|jgi:hypothetical protein